MGVKLRVEQLSANSEGEGATYRWHDKVYGLTVDYTAVVEKWVKDREKLSRTLGSPRLVVMSGSRMHITLEPTDHETRIAIDFEYDPPKPLPSRLLSHGVGKLCRDRRLDRIMADGFCALRAALLPASLAEVDS